jgi:hexosaminidase
MPDPAAMEPLLIPRPQSIKLTGGRAPIGDLNGKRNRIGHLQMEDVSDAPREGWYRLEIFPDTGAKNPQIRIRASSRDARLHALTTLSQLDWQYPHEGPSLEIEDWPSFGTRGVMLDISRDRVPLFRECGDQVNKLGHIKLNHLQYYTEHTFAYRGHEDVWRGWSPFDRFDIEELQQQCVDRVELVANQNCFGHLASWLRHPKYAHLAETHGDWVFDVWPRSGPFSLCPTDPRSLELIEDLLGQLLPCFKSPLVNIGCDETYDIAYGRSKDEVARRGRTTVYLDFVAKVAAIARRHGKRSMFWADIALSHPECVKDIPQDMIALAWGYEPEAPFAKWCELLRSAGREVWVCPGTSSWRSITGRTTERHGNIRAAAEQGAAGGASGMLMCDWGDTGHHQQWPISLMGLAHGAAAAWNPAAPFDPRAASLHVFRDKSLRLGDWLEELGDVDLKLRQTCGALSAPGRVKLPNQSALFIDMLKKPDEQADIGRPEDWEEAREHMEQLASSRPSLPSEQMNDELKHTVEVASFAAARAAGRRRLGGLGDAEKKRLREQLDGIIAEHRRLWLLRSREGGLEHSCGYYRQIWESLA